MKISSRSLIVLLVGMLAAAAGANSLLGLLSVAVLAVGLRSLWLPGLSPVFAFIFCYQWLQASTKIFHGNLRGVEVNELAAFGGNVEVAIVLSLLGLVALAIGMRWGLGAAQGWQRSSAASGIEHTSALFWVKCYYVAFVAAVGVQSVTYVVPALSQPLLALAGLKWAFYFILTYVAFSRTGAVRWFWLLAFLLELGLGFGGYFSDFKTVLFYTAFGLLATGVRLSGPRIFGLLVLVAMALFLAVGWTAIKTDQRDFLNQGSQSQIVAVDFGQGMTNLLGLVGQLDAVAMRDASEAMARRISYVDFFGNVIDTVPSQMAHEHGALWADAIVRPFTPRLFFPGKGVIDDSERTNHYTNLNVSGVKEGTSISLGYMAESYIDFGPWLMMLPVMALGWMLGRFYRWMVNYPHTRGIVGVGFATVTLFPAALLETSITKMFGGLVVAMLIAWLVARWLVPRFYVPAAQIGQRAAPRR